MSAITSLIRLADNKFSYLGINFCSASFPRDQLVHYPKRQSWAVNI